MPFLGGSLLIAGVAIFHVFIAHFSLGSGFWMAFAQRRAIHLYVFHRDHMSPRDHNRLVWIFALCSIGTLLIINAILSFMLTPGTWKPMDAGVLVYKGVLNPGYLPTSLGRILVSLALAGAGWVLLASLTKSVGEKARRKLVRISCAMILPIILCLPLGV